MDSVLPMVFMIDSKTEHLHTWCNSLGEFADPMFSPEPIQKAAAITEELSGMETSSMWHSVSSTFS